MSAEVLDEWTDEAIAGLEHSFIGPTWATDDEGDFLLPELTLGWQVIEWCMRWLNSPTGDVDDTGEPEGWMFTNEQARFVLWWYAVDRDGRFIYRTGVLQRLKGWGKDPLLAVLCIVELIGPSRVVGWDGDGQPVGDRHPSAYVQVIATTAFQTQTTFSLFPQILSNEVISTYGLDVQGENIWTAGRKQRLVAVTSNPRALEGGRVTFSVLNETHHWVDGNGLLMFETVRDNTTKAPYGKSRWLAITNAFLPGEGSVAEELRGDYEEAAERGTLAASDFLYDSLEAAPNTPLIPRVLRKVLEVVRGDAVWLDIDSIVSTMTKRSTKVARSRRMYLNQIVSADDSLIPFHVWASLQDTDLTLQKGDAITLGFDGGRTDDATALVAMRVRDRLIVPLGIWEKGDPDFPDGGQISKAAVNSAVAWAFKHYRVLAFFADVERWEVDIAQWAETYRSQLEVAAPGDNPISHDMRSLKKTTMAHERWLSAIEDGRVKHQGKATELSRRLWRHTMNARRRENNWGVSFGKAGRESPHKVDAYAAAVLAHEAGMAYLARRNNEKQKRAGGRVYSAAGAL